VPDKDLVAPPSREAVALESRQARFFDRSDKAQFGIVKKDLVLRHSIDVVVREIKPQCLPITQQIVGSIKINFSIYQ
jgi:hypothetical protein